MKKSASTIVLFSCVALSACNPTSTPLIDMCQKITQNLVGNVSEWQEPQKIEGVKAATVQLAYNTSDGATGSATCEHPMEDTGNYRVAPLTMSLNGAPVGNKDLISASFGATKQIVKDTAENTKEKTVQLAQDASEKAKVVADQAQVMAADAKVKAQELAVKAEALAGDAQVKANELAAQAKLKASDLASQASDLTAVATERAREAALAMTKAAQEKLEK